MKPEERPTGTWFCHNCQRKWDGSELRWTGVPLKQFDCWQLHWSWSCGSLICSSHDIIKISDGPLLEEERKARPKWRPKPIWSRK